MLARNKPIVGQEVFSHESGIHVDGLIKDSRTYEYISPSELGRESKFVLGKTSGKAAVKNELEKRGIKFDNDKVVNILKKLRDGEYLDNNILYYL